MTRPLSSLQVDVLFVVQQNSPVSVADVAYHLNIDTGPCRSRLSTLERRGLVARQYTGHHRSGLFAYTVTDAGTAALAELDSPDAGGDGDDGLDLGECYLCGLFGGRHLRACLNHPGRNSAGTPDAGGAQNGSGNSMTQPPSGAR